jgi:hypothetical protein
MTNHPTTPMAQMILLARRSTVVLSVQNGCGRRSETGALSHTPAGKATAERYRIVVQPGNSVPK